MPFLSDTYKVHVARSLSSCQKMPETVATRTLEGNYLLQRNDSISLIYFRDSTVVLKYYRYYLLLSAWVCAEAKAILQPALVQICVL